MQKLNDLNSKAMRATAANFRSCALPHAHDLPVLLVKDARDRVIE
jgi:hypothetical protein